MKKSVFLVVLVSVFSVIMLWLPFFLRLESFWGLNFAGKGMEVIVQNFDGLNFLTVAKTGYDSEMILREFQQILSGRKPIYFAAHYPMFPLVIAFFDLFVNGALALLASIVSTNVLLAIGLYVFFRVITKSSKKSLALSIVALFFPARQLLVRGVGSNETLFISLILLSLVNSGRKKHVWAGVFGALAVLTRSPGILLFAAYALVFLSDKKRLGEKVREFLPYLMIPTALLGLWVFYGMKFGDFWAYFKVGGNINLYFPPFQVFNTSLPWTSGIWLEDVIYLYVFYTIGIAMFWSRIGEKSRRLLPVAVFGVLYLTSVFFIAHRDIARYALPVAPIVIAGYAQFMGKLRLRYLVYLAPLLIPIYLYSWNFALENLQSVVDWAPFL